MHIKELSARPGDHMNSCTRYRSVCGHADSPSASSGTDYTQTQGKSKNHKFAWGDFTPYTTLSVVRPLIHIKKNSPKSPLRGKKKWINRKNLIQTSSLMLHPTCVCCAECEFYSVITSPQCTTVALTQQLMLTDFRGGQNCEVMYNTVSYNQSEQQLTWCTLSDKWLSLNVISPSISFTTEVIAEAEYLVFPTALRWLCLWLCCCYSSFQIPLLKLCG